MRYRVITRVVEECIYEVEATDRKDAEAKSCDASPFSTETLQEETLSITPIGDPREHRWVAATPLVRWPHCGDCGIIKRKDGRNSKECKGPPRVGPRSPSPQGADRG